MIGIRDVQFNLRENSQVAWKRHCKVWLRDCAPFASEGAHVEIRRATQNCSRAPTIGLTTLVRQKPLDKPSETLEYIAPPYTSKRLLKR